MKEKQDKDGKKDFDIEELLFLLSVEEVFFNEFVGSFSLLVDSLKGNEQLLDSSFKKQVNDEL